MERMETVERESGWRKGVETFGVKSLELVREDARFPHQYGLQYI